MNEYATEFKDAWMRAGGLITPATAAKMLEVTTARIAQMQKEGKLQVFKDKAGKTMLSFHEINKLITEKNEKDGKIKKYKVKYTTDDGEKETIIEKTFSPTMEEITKAITEKEKDINNIKSIKISITQP